MVDHAELYSVTVLLLTRSMTAFSAITMNAPLFWYTQKGWKDTIAQHTCVSKEPTLDVWTIL
jgi:hypothetical protein